MSQSPDTEIILRDRIGRAIGSITLAALAANVGYFTVRWNKRGNIKYAMRKERKSTVPLSHDGEHFIQELPSGRAVHALRGTRGSK